MEQASVPLIGDQFPEMKVQTTHGVKNLPEDYKGQWFILFSHPADFTPVCTTEFYAFQTRYAQFRELNVELLGLSVDQVFSHMKWTEWIKDNLKVKIEFPIIADTGEVAVKLGLIHPGSPSHTVRGVYFVDPTGKIRAILYYPEELGRNFDEFLRMIKAFKVHEKQHVAMPANWPNNELFGDDVILPPASNEELAEERRGKKECLDWWLCHVPVE
jgi:peroxiredoxin (alkyl hydroperoxide reductase subunit C)